MNEQILNKWSNEWILPWKILEGPNSPSWFLGTRKARELPSTEIDCPLNPWPLEGCVYYMVSLVRVFHSDGEAENAMCFYVPNPLPRPLPLPDHLPSSSLLLTEIIPGLSHRLSEVLVIPGGSVQNCLCKDTSLAPCSPTAPEPVSAIACFTCGWYVNFWNTTHLWALWGGTDWDWGLCLQGIGMEQGLHNFSGRKKWWMKLEWSQEILNLGSVLARQEAWTFPERSETNHLDYHPRESGAVGEGGPWIMVLETQYQYCKQLKKKKKPSLAHTLWT